MTDALSDRSDHPRRPWAAALLSLLQPGLGQLYGGRPGRALLALGLTLVPVVLLIGGAAASFPLLVAVLALALVLYIGIVIDTAVLARRTSGFQLRWYNRWYIYLGLLVMFGLGRELLGVAVQAADLPVRTYSIPAGSIEPALQVGDFIVAGRAVAPRREDIVIFEAEGHTAVKRIVAVAGDEVVIRAKRLFVNGRPAAEPWVRHRDPTTYPDSPLIASLPRRRDHLPPTRVPAGHVFVLGDNRDHSHDSRFYGPVPVAKLRGRPLYLYWSRDRSRIGKTFGA